MPGEAEGPGLAQPGERRLCRSLRAAPSTYREAAEKMEPGSSAVRGKRMRNNEQKLKWENQTGYQKNHFAREDSRAGCPERLPNLCRVRNLSQGLINTLAGQKQQQTINQ